MIDTHTHLFDTAFDTDRQETIARAVTAGVSQFILPAIDSTSHSAMLEMCEAYTNCFATIGLHPTSVNDNPKWIEELKIVHDYLFTSQTNFIAVGEIGLDLHWSSDYIIEQQQALTTQIRWALQKNLPIILHVRDAWDEIFDTLKPFSGRLKGVFHSFSGTYEQYLQTQQLGDFYVGIGGPLTYKKSPLPKVIQRIPLERILLETDAPYLPPAQHRGTRNEPAYLQPVVIKIAELLDIQPFEVDRVTTQNARRLFKI